MWRSASPRSGRCCGIWPEAACSLAAAWPAAPVALRTTWANAPTFCPAQYTRSTEGESGTIYQCDFQGAVTVNVNGSLFSRTWWRMNGDAVDRVQPRRQGTAGPVGHPL